MQRDMELVRNLLLAVEASSRPSDAHLVSVLGDDIAKGSFEQIEKAISKLEYHLWMLTEAKFLTGTSVPSFGGKRWFDLELTWQGQEFLDAVRDPDAWRCTKDGTNAVGNWMSS